ncbi:MAG TPA: type 4a pilus biogenesis protein PilO [Chitinispirillaceae bacterium]|nr:type 4a pilus biogenesis protein PilO [Chitinispirillaceae bacterium]
MQLEFSNPLNSKRGSDKLTESPSGGQSGLSLPFAGIRGGLCLTLPIVITLIALYCSIAFLYPLFTEQFAKSKSIIATFREKENLDAIQQKIDTCKLHTAKLSQLINTCNLSSQPAGAIIDLLYEYAGSAKFTLLKVETGEPVIIERFAETPYIIQGKGCYASIGTFIQQIENSRQSTRVRQIVMNNAENGQLETLIEFVVIGD